MKPIPRQSILVPRATRSGNWQGDAQWAHTWVPGGGQGQAFLRALCTAFVVTALACSDEPSAQKPDPGPQSEPKTSAEPSPPRDPEAPSADSPEPEPDEPPPRLYARKYVSRVWSEPSVESKQLGYMRAGSIVTAKTGQPVGHARCRRGWYEVQETGGFVCDGREVTAFHGDELPDIRPTQADRTAALPYGYAYNTQSGTPMYKRLPTREEALRWEHGRLPDGRKIEEGEGTDAGLDAGLDAGTQEEGPQPQASARRPKTLAELQGERGALVRRILQAGFYVSLDRELERDSRHYWRTMSSGHVPKNRLKNADPSDFEGVPLAQGAHPRVAAPSPESDETDKDAGTRDEPSDVDAGTLPGPAHAPPYHLPIAYVVSNKRPRYTRTPRGALRLARKRPGYHHVFEIVAEEEARGRRYLRDAEGYLYRADHVRRIDRVEPPEEIEDSERWLDIDLSNQSLVAYEGAAAVRAMLISSGRVRGPPGSPRYHATPPGLYHVLSKHVSATMDGDHALAGPYSLEDVPYVQFFQGALALHSAFWHDRFGRPSSHGCINLAPREALWLFDWTSPNVPVQWHAAYPPSRTAGTLIRIRGETPRR